jgi:alkanesulfonate monooxygenase SsuD/methylene tetrahydromethanopterin reductase-like flavin-dependent oxidoreductase (luciferase family)
MLKLTGAAADGWMPSLAFLGLDKLPDTVRRIDDAAAAAGRDPARLRKVYNIAGLTGPESVQPFVGPVSEWVDRLVAIVTGHGMNAFVFFPAEDHESQIARFAWTSSPPYAPRSPQRHRATLPHHRRRHRPTESGCSRDASPFTTDRGRRPRRRCALRS